MKNLLTIKDLSQKQILNLLDQAQVYISEKAHLIKKHDALKTRTIANLFFEPSTRTRCSFELAANRLGATVLNVDLVHSSTKKGESLTDTIHSLEAMGIDAFVIRHQEAGLPKFIANHLKTAASVINAGDGDHAHPTQALLDMLSIRQQKKDFADLSVAIIGDILHSRVAHSDITALKTLGVTDIRLIGPENLLPKEQEQNCQHFVGLEQGIESADVIISLRIQKERMQQSEIPDNKTYFQQFGLRPERLQKAKADVLIMHPGPMNRDVEIASAVADGPQSVILQQVANGVAARMAVLKQLLT